MGPQDVVAQAVVASFSTVWCDRAVRAALLVVAACAGNHPIAAADVDAAYVDAHCAFLVRCGVLPDLATCHRAYLSTDFPLEASEVAAAIAGKIHYDGDKARECIDGYASAACDTTDPTSRTTPVACDQIVAGTVADSGTCVLARECVSSVCNIPVCVVDCCAGSCAGSAPPVRGKLGQACTLLPCESGAYCDGASTTCTALFTAGTSCIGDFQCAFGLGCAGAAGSKTCKPLPKLGEACPDGKCRDTGVVCNAAMTCTKVGLVGAACTTAADCSQFYTCDPTGHCAEKSAVGGPCGFDPDCFDITTYCAVPTGQTLGTCAPAQANGGSCSADRACASEHCNDTTTQCAIAPICT